MKRVHWMLMLLLGMLVPAAGGLVVKRMSGTDEAKAKLFAPNPTKATLYVFRDRSFTGKNDIARLLVNNQVVTENAHNKFSVVTLSVGSYDLGCATGHDANLAVSFAHNTKKDPVHLSVEAGQIYYVQQVFKAFGGFSLKMSSAQAAQPIIKKAELSEMVDRP